MRLLAPAILGLCSAIALSQTPPAAKPAQAAGDEPRAAAATAPAPAAPKAGAPAPAGDKPAPRSAVAALRLHVESVEFNETPLVEVFNKLSDAAGVTIYVRWAQLDKQALEKDFPITFKARNLSLEQTLWLVLDRVRAADVRLAYLADKHLILVSTEDDLGNEMITKVYRVADLTQTIPRQASIFAGRVVGYPIITGVGVAPGAVGYGVEQAWTTSGVSVEVDSAGDDPVNEDVDRANLAPPRHMRELVNMIQASVEPESWDVNGGRGSVRAFQGMLVIRNTLKVHQLIGGRIREETAP